MSEVSICNQALGWLGENPIISLDDPNKAAALCKVNYGPLRNAVLEAHNWSFAIRRYTLPKLTEPPEFGYANAYLIPTEVLRVWEVNSLNRNDPTRDWQVEGEHIVTDDATCKVKAVTEIVDTTKFSALYIQALAARIAADLAIPITSSRSLQSDMFQIYQGKLQQAISSDNRQGKSKRMRSRWLSNARLSSGTKSAGPVV